MRAETNSYRETCANGRVCFGNIFFEFNNQIKKQISWTAIGIKCAPTYAYVFMDKVKTEFLETQKDKAFWWVRYIDGIFFIWTHVQKKLKVFFKKN